MTDHTQDAKPEPIGDDALDAAVGGSKAFEGTSDAYLGGALGGESPTVRRKLPDRTQVSEGSSGTGKE